MPPRESMHHIGKVFSTSSPCLRESQCITLVKFSPNPVHASTGVDASHRKSVHHIQSMQPQESTRQLGNMFTTSSYKRPRESMHHIRKESSTLNPCHRRRQFITLVKCSPHPVRASPGNNASHWYSVQYIQSMPWRESTHHIGKLFTTFSPCLPESQCITLVKCSPHLVHASPRANASHW